MQQAEDSVNRTYYRRPSSSGLLKVAAGDDDDVRCITVQILFCSLLWRRHLTSSSLLQADDVGSIWELDKACAN